MFLWANKRIKVSPNFLDSIFNNFLVSFCVVHNGPTSIYFFFKKLLIRKNFKLLINKKCLFVV